MASCWYTFSELVTFFIALTKCLTKQFKEGFVWGHSLMSHHGRKITQPDHETTGHTVRKQWDEGWCPACFLLFIQSRTLACGMVPLTFRMGLHPLVKAFRKHSLRDTQRYVSMVILNLVNWKSRLSHHIDLWDLFPSSWLSRILASFDYDFFLDNLASSLFHWSTDPLFWQPELQGLTGYLSARGSFSLACSTLAS